MSALRFLFLVVIPPSVGGAQVIGGKVVDSASRAPLTDVAISALDVSLDSAIAKAQTDSSGVFYLELRRPGTYRLRFDVVPTSLTLRDSFVVAADDFVEREFVLAVPPNPVFFEEQVDKPASGRPETLSLRYPDDLRFGRVTGSVLATYVVSKEGRIEPNSITILQSSNPKFAESVLYALRRLQFFPATYRGKPVRQVVHQPFHFCMVDCGGTDSNPRAVSVTVVRPGR